MAKQIKNVKAKIAKRCGVLYRIKDKVDIDVLKVLYISLALPHLNYFLEIWVNNYGSRLNDLFLMQKRIIRILGKVKYNDQAR